MYYFTFICQILFLHNNELAVIEMLSESKLLYVDTNGITMSFF